MTRLFLAAGVAALAIASAAAAKPGGGGSGNPHNDRGGQPAAEGGGNGGGRGHGGGDGGGGGGGAAPAFAGGGGGGGHGHGGGFAAPQMRVERQQTRGFERQETRGFERQQARGFERQQARGFERQQARGFERQQARQQASRGFERQQARQQDHGFARQQERMAQQNRGFARQQDRMAQQAENRFAQREAARNDRFDRLQRQAVANNVVNAEQARAFRNAQTSFVDNGAGVRNRGLIDGCPPGLWMKNNGCLPPGQAAKLLGTQIAAAASIAPLYALPQSLNYLYPDTPDYYYRYGDGYLYQVNRGTNLIDALLPLIGGGYVPGQYLPNYYMSSYVPNYYGLNAFYPDYGYDGLCNRYAYGVVYQVDCVTGYVVDVIPTYASGYGVGQLLPSAYSYYNVPTQYRTLYYDTPDYGYWYAPGAIYQYDQRSSMITSVAALMSPGFTLGQPLPLGYDAYNVPFGYRATYYDTPNAWYRYNNGYIYQVDPVTQIVTAIVASLLT